MVLLKASVRPLAAGEYVVEDTLDSELVASLECLADEQRPIIVNNSSWHAEAIDHVMFYEFDHVRCLHLL